MVLLGAPAVGKTSLIARYVHSVFSERHKSTLGVKVDRKSVHVDDETLAMLIWDMHGEAEGLEVPSSYFSGAMAGLVVFDRTRPETVAVARSLGERLVAASPDAQLFYAANKSDLDCDEAGMRAELKGLEAHATSAKSGDGVHDLFTTVARALL